MKERVISAVIALIIVVPFLLLGGNYFTILVAVIGLLGLKELLSLRKNVPVMVKYVSYVLFLVLLVCGYTFTGKLYIMNFSFLVISILFLFLPLLLYHNNKKYNIEDVFYLLSSIVFLSAAFNLFIVIRAKGLMLFLYLFLITTMTDTFAYVMGSKFGKKKLLPSVSPNKSVEGSFYGLLIGTLIASVFYYFCVSSEGILGTVLVTMVLSILGQCGDLIFSHIKRHYGIKDFSNIMPGHGGILDRLDSIILVMFGYIIFVVIL